jgi:pyridoxamine 5'-phosphate oxidase
MAMAFHEMRVAYRNGELAESAAGNNPLELFMAWIGTARGSGAILEPNAMTLATVDEAGRPAARMVLLKEVEDDGSFVFYTNRDGRKGRELAANPHAALVFWWEPLERQVRIEGAVSETSAAEPHRRVGIAPERGGGGPRGAGAALRRGRRRVSR